MDPEQGGNAAVSPNEIDTSSSPETTAEVTPETTPETPAADAAPETKVETPQEEKLFDLPDGRKVDAAGLKAEYEKLLPEFTRRSQELSELKRGRESQPINKDEPAWKKPDYVPKTYAEIIEIAKQAAIEDLARSAQEEEDRVKAVTAQVDGQIAEIKKIDPKIDENALFQHANKYGFTDLRAAHANMRDIQKVALDTEQRVIKNLKTREADPVSGGSGNATVSDGYDPSVTGQYSNAVEYLSRLKK